MNFKKYKTLSRLFLLTLSCALLVTVLYNESISRKVCADVPGCPSWVTPSGKGWVEGSTVYVNFGNITDGGIQNQIRRAIATWNTAN